MMTQITNIRDTITHIKHELAEGVTCHPTLTHCMNNVSKYCFVIKFDANRAQVSSKEINLDTHGPVLHWDSAKHALPEVVFNTRFLEFTPEFLSVAKSINWRCVIGELIKESLVNTRDEAKQTLMDAEQELSAHCEAYNIKSDA